MRSFRALSTGNTQEKTASRVSCSLRTVVRRHYCETSIVHVRTDYHHLQFKTIENELILHTRHRPFCSGCAELPGQYPMKWGTDKISCSNSNELIGFLGNHFWRIYSMDPRSSGYERLGVDYRRYLMHQISGKCTPYRFQVCLDDI